MTYGPPDPNVSEGQVPPQVPPPGPVPPHPQQPWPPQPATATTGPGLAVVSVVLGVLGIVVAFLPIDETGIRHYVALPFALGGLVLGIAGLVGPRRGKPVAAVGLALSVLALLVAMLFLGVLIMSA